MAENPHDITMLLHQWRGGDPHAGKQVMELMYSELHHIAARAMRREREGHTLQTTAIIHEAYLRLCGSESIQWTNRAHFLAVAARQLRRILVDHARQSRSQKRGGGEVHLALWEIDAGSSPMDDRVLAVDQALERLEQLDARAAKAIELRFFGGLSETEAAEALDVSVDTIKRDWHFAKTWLASQLK